jgi:hypothetical protein
MTTPTTSRSAPPVGILLAVAIICALGGPRELRAQLGDFQIVWVVVGEAASADGNGTVRAGRQLFGASDLLSRNLNSVKVENVTTEPVAIQMTAGQQLCLSSLHIRAFGPDRKPIAGAPLSVAIRQDHKESLRLQRSRKDICVKPDGAGEYPVRLTSLLPAPDGTMRGAQVFLRVAAPIAQD